jgi:hypothetical protein
MPSSSDEEVFAGFQGFSVPRYTQFPDELIDRFLAHLTGAELKVLVYIIRHTLGYKRDGDRISASQIANGIVRRDGTRVDTGTGLTVRHVRSVVAALETKSLLVVQRAMSEDHGSEVNYYSLRWADERTDAPWREGGASEMISPGGCNHFTPPGEMITPPPVKSFHPQEQTLSREESRKNLSQENATGVAELSGAWFEAIGERRPSVQKRESVYRIIGNLLEQGYTDTEIRAACGLAVKRGAKGPGLLPFIIGEVGGGEEEEARPEPVFAEPHNDIPEWYAAYLQLSDCEQAGILEQATRTTVFARASEATRPHILQGIIAGIMHGRPR